MTFFTRISQFHSENRAAFVLFTEFIGFVTTIATMVGVAVLFSMLH
jgi:hypothetical protein